MDWKGMLVKKKKRSYQLGKKMDTRLKGNVSSDKMKIGNQKSLMIFLNCG
jgi:hypothetical protein